MDIIEKLTYFNLTRQEATLYLTLLAEGRLTGYEATKLTGISRSNTYTALAGLVEKGALMCLRIRLQDIRRCPWMSFAKTG